MNHFKKMSWNRVDNFPSFGEKIVLYRRGKLYYGEVSYVSAEFWVFSQFEIGGQSTFHRKSDCYPGGHLWAWARHELYLTLQLELKLKDHELTIELLEHSGE